MPTANAPSVAREARVIFEKIRASLEPEHPDEFLAVEPVSGRYFLGATLSEAIGAARREYPDRLTHAFRLGHRAAIHFGLHIR
jgi:hypothetical protein